ncbi:hypothetical protein ACVWZ4_004389 [Bradyrhizobium sp. USDA 4472]
MKFRARTAEECRKLAMGYRSLADIVGITPRTASVLKNIANNLTALAEE